MNDFPPKENGVAAIRVSSVKQGTEGDSPEAQKEQMAQFFMSQNLNLKKVFIFLESASKDEQPMQEAIDYCKDPKNDIQVFVIKSIDRFTRGGSYSYDFLKMQLERYNVKLVDIYGIISSQKINTLAHLGVEYKWSVFSPSKKSEILEAERAKDEMRDIMSRMIGAEIRYARMGYWIRRAPYGFDTDKLETSNGKRCILRPNASEAPFVIKMFELRARGTLTDEQIVEEINRLGYKSRLKKKRDKHDKTTIVGQTGGNELNLKHFLKFVQYPIYAGINTEKWTQGKATKCKFEGLVSIDLFNAANKGKLTIVEENGEVALYRIRPPEYRITKGVKNPEFPYKKYVMCPTCEKPLYGSASKGRLGKYYPAYHCNSRGHYFRVPSRDFEETITKFVKNLQVSPEYIDALVEAVVTEWEKREKELHKDDVNIDARIAELKAQARMTADKIRFLNSEVAIKYIEEDLLKIEGQIAMLIAEKANATVQEPINIRVIMEKVKYFLEHLDELLLYQINPLAKAAYFGVIWDKAPTYQEILSGTQDLSLCEGLNEVFKLKNMENDSMVGHQGLEPWTRRLRVSCSNQLS